MQIRTPDALHLQSVEYLPTIEVVLNPPEGFPSYDINILYDAIRELISNDPCAVATFYLEPGNNHNCDESIYITVIGIAGSTEVFEAIYEKYVSKNWLCARRGQLVSQDQSLPSCHIEDSRFWENYDEMTWLSGDAGDVFHCSDLYLSEKTGIDIYLLDGFGCGWETLNELRLIIRCYVNITGQAIRFIDPEGRPLRSNAKIATLKKRWFTYLNRVETWKFSNFEELDDEIFLKDLRQKMESLLAFPRQAIQFITPSGALVHDNTKLKELKKLWKKQTAVLEKLKDEHLDQMSLSKLPSTHDNCMQKGHFICHDFIEHYYMLSKKKKK